MTPPDHYFTVKGYGETEIIIQKSRFITYTQRVDTEKEASDFINEISKKHWDATHNCYAFVIQDQTEIQRSSDDGEPSGTAGRPILEVIRARNLTNTAIVVTRYFGGIKLGAGGLIRAYSQAASEGLKAAGEIIWELHQSLEVTVDYPAMGKVEHELHKMDWQVEPPRFTDQVHWRVWIPAGREQPLFDLIAELTSGKGTVSFKQREYRFKVRE